mmetsp:Transcript_4902/g.10274  ORF Transcript_4902/g.10274 Transcript_4902/m.10274 type:complete len:268 (+) Transcript_4902:1593-2396(+)
MRFPSKRRQQRSFGSLGDLDIDFVSSEREPVNVGGDPLDVERVFGVQVGDFGIERIDSGNSSGGNLSLAEGFLDLFGGGLDVLEGLENGSRYHDEMRGHFDGHGLLPNQSIQPGSVDGIVLEIFRFQQLDQILHRVPNVPPHFHLLQRQHQRLPCLLAIGALGEQVPELGIGEFVNAPVGADAEVSPHVGRGLELDAFDGSGGGFESLVGVFGRDARGDDVGVYVAVSFGEEVDLFGAVGVGLVVELSDLGYFVEGDAHGDLELGGG